MKSEKFATAMDKFIIRAYTKKELALMYFPDSSPRTAVSHLMSWIRRCTQLWQQLQEVLPSLVRHQLPARCKDYSDYYVSIKRKEAEHG